MKHMGSFNSLKRKEKEEKKKEAKKRNAICDGFGMCTQGMNQLLNDKLKFTTSRT